MSSPNSEFAQANQLLVNFVASLRLKLSCMKPDPALACFSMARA